MPSGLCITFRMAQMPAPVTCLYIQRHSCDSILFRAVIHNFVPDAGILLPDLLPAFPYAQLVTINGSSTLCQLQLGKHSVGALRRHTKMSCARSSFATKSFPFAKIALEKKFQSSRCCSSAHYSQNHQTALCAAEVCLIILMMSRW